MIQAFRQGRSEVRRPQAGFTLIEMMISALVLAIGLVGGLALIITAMANDSRSKMDSTATVLSQLTMETIASVSAGSGTSVSIVDCNPTSSSATHSITTVASTTGAGAPLTSGGNIDFTQSTMSGYSMSYYACQASTGDRQATYDIRWNIKQLSSNANLVTVAAREVGGNATANFFAIPVSLKVIVGL